MIEKKYNLVADQFKALSHPVRLQIIDILRHEPACVCHINTILNQRQAYISQQLSVLKDAGFIASEKIGWNVFYTIIEPKILETIDTIQVIIDSDFQSPKYGVIESCPCPKCSQK